jgi:hypothetical protein
MTNLVHKSKGMSFKGHSTLTIWKAGFLPDLMSNGYTLREAMELGREAGMEVDVLDTDNLIVTAGLQLTADILGGDDASSLTYHAIGTGTAIPVAGDTILSTEVGRKAWASTVRSGAEVTFSAFYSAAQSTYALEECGVWGGTTAGTALNSGRFFSHYLQSYDNSGGLNDLTYDYILTVDTA